MKKVLKSLPAFLLAGVVALSLTACGGNPSSPPAPPAPSKPAWSTDPETLVQAFGDFHTPLQAAYLLSPYTEATLYAKGVSELSRPRAITLEWNASAEAQKYYVQIATREDFSDAVTYETEDPSYALYNLYLGCDYYWRTAASEAELESAETQTFTTTSAAPRNLYLDGITNVRDLGGWATENGGHVKQGLLYRGARLNESSASTFKLELTESALDVFKNVMKIKTELDLRQTVNNETGSIENGVVVEGVNYLSVPLVPPPIQNPNNVIENNMDEVKEIFRILADESNYPLYFHCNIGTDRTGFVAFMVNALLGVAEEDLFRDYLFSNFGVVRGARTIDDFKALYADEINKLEGDTFADRTEKYLVDLGVITSEQVASIRSILLDAEN